MSKEHHPVARLILCSCGKYVLPSKYQKHLFDEELNKMRDNLKLLGK